MAIKKGLVIGCSAAVLLSFCCAGGGGALFFWVFSLTSELAKAGDDFLALLGQGKVTEAYESAASGLRIQQTPEDFAAEVKRLGLTEYASSSWPQRNFVNEQGTLDGTITTKAGGTLPLKITLIKESGVWRVLSLTSSGAGVGAAAAKRIVPPDDELRKLVKTTMVDFSAAVKNKDFTALHATLSKPMQSAFTPAQLQEKFQEFVTKQIDLSAIKDTDPVFDVKPLRDERGRLVLSGFFLIVPARAEFELTYAYEHPNWKLDSIHVKTGK